MSHRRTACLNPRSRSGFTLVELMVTVAVIGILAIIAMPGVRAMINNSRISGQTEELVSTLQLARAEAIRRNKRLTVCPTDGSNTFATDCAGSASWTNWAILDRTITSGDLPDRVILNNASSGTLQLSGPAAGIVFKPSGLIDSQQQLEVTMSDLKRCLLVRISGVVSVSKEACP